VNPAAQLFATLKVLRATGVETVTEEQQSAALA
jgi:hypothetical protein